MTDHGMFRAAAAAATLICAAGALVGTALGAALVAAAVLVLGLAAATFVRVAMTHGRLTRRLKARSTVAEVAGIRMHLAPVRGSVFVAGVTRPAIFCDSILLDDLDDAEIKAVVLHERAHQLARDPLRNAAVGVITPLLTRLDPGRVWLEQRAAAREIAADQYAIARGADRRAIASALFKVPPTGAVHAAAFAPAIELRLRALLDGHPARQRPRPWLAITLGVIVGATACVAIVHPATPLAGLVKACCTL